MFSHFWLYPIRSHPHPAVAAAAFVRPQHFVCPVSLPFVQLRSPSSASSPTDLYFSRVAQYVGLTACVFGVAKPCRNPKHMMHTRATRERVGDSTMPLISSKIERFASAWAWHAVHIASTAANADIYYERQNSCDAHRRSSWIKSSCRALQSSLSRRLLRERGRKGWFQHLF